MSSIYANPYNQTIKINGFGLGIAAGVPVKKILRQGATYFSMPDLTEYKLLLSNDNMTRCDVTVYIDDRDIGTWRLNPHSSISVERPANISKKFVLIKEGTNIAYQSGIGTYDTNGLVKAVFKPEKMRLRRRPVGPRPRPGSSPIIRDPRWELERGRYQDDFYDETYQLNNMESKATPDANMYMSSSIGLSSSPSPSNKRMNYTNSISPAGTGLGDYSDQQFDRVNGLFNIDYSNITTINVRLMVEEEPYNPNRLVSLRKYPNYPRPLSNPVPPKINGYDYDYDYDNDLYYGNSNGYNDPNNNYYYDYTTNQYFLRQ